MISGWSPQLSEHQPKISTDVLRLTGVVKAGAIYTKIITKPSAEVLYAV